ncbi:MAG: cytidylate kinase-like family protein [Treponema sp.]|nr:cytidylate kinase-like family protein [Treponema sp.]
MVITISREYGSGGKKIAKKVAEKLNIAFYDKEIIEKIAEETGFSKEFITEKGEYSSSNNIFSFAFTSRDASGKSLEDVIFQAQRKVILELAEKGPFVIVGRSADQILKGKTELLNVFIYGNEAEKAKFTMETNGCSESEARSINKNMDKRRAIQYNYVTDAEWGKRNNYDLMLNSSVLGEEKCAEIIANLYK